MEDSTSAAGSTQPVGKTFFLLSNFHCSSCAAVIQETLSKLQPPPFLISPSLVSSLVTVEHPYSLSVRDMQDALEDAGFDVISSEDDLGKIRRGPNEEHLYLDRLLGIWKHNPDHPASHKTSEQLAKHVQNCASCKISTLKQDGLDQRSEPPLLPTRMDSVSHSATRDAELPLVIVDSMEYDVFRASLAIGGMTCASCTGSIVEQLQKIDWVRKVNVNLLSNSATVEFVGEEHANMIAAQIEDIGFEASIDTVENLKAEIPVNNLRTVEILIDGVYCTHCPVKVVMALETFGDRITIEREPTILNPVLKISYTPNVPSFTIRDILLVISAVEPLKPSIYHPPTLEERSRRIHARERLRLFIRVLVTVAIAIPTFIIGILYMSLVPSRNSSRKFLMREWQYGLSRATWSLFILSTPVYFLCADVFHVRMLKELRSMWRPGSRTPIVQRFYRFGSMNMLMSFGTSIAYWSSVAELIVVAATRPMMMDDGAFYFDSVVFLTMFLLIGRLIEAYSKSKAGDAVLLLGNLRPSEAILIEQGEGSSSEIPDDSQATTMPKSESVKKISLDLLEFGDMVKVPNGSSPPCDGKILSGGSSFDESSLTGESKLVQKSVGDTVYAGTINKSSPVSIQITGVAGSSMLDQIVKAVREGQTRRAPMERIADTLTSYFVPFVTITAISTWIIWLALGYSGTLPLEYLGGVSGGWAKWSLQFAIAVFVVACPCGLGLAAPTALFVGGGLAAQNGILAKGGGEAFEKASKLDCIVFDKTGTLTIGGEPVVTDFVNNDPEIEGLSSPNILEMVKCLEENSTHPIAKAIISYCKGHTSDIVEVASPPEEIVGQGMKGGFSIGKAQFEILVGNENMMASNSVAINPLSKSELQGWKSAGKSIALVALRQLNKSNECSLVAMFAISDPIRPEASAVIRALRELGTDVWMLSGDNEVTARAIGLQVGISHDNVIAGVLPSQKAEKIRYLQRAIKSKSVGSKSTTQRAIVAMVGDGINDSPALTMADVGIAIGSGSDIAISSAEFVLVSSNLESLLTLLDLSKVVFRRIKFNFAWAMVYNMIALPVAAGVLYPIISKGKHVRLDPVWASLAMALSSISVVCSSLLMKWQVPLVGWRKKTIQT